MPAIVESVAGGILSFLGKSVEFKADLTRDLFLFVAGVGEEVIYLMQKVKQRK